MQTLSFGERLSLIRNNKSFGKQTLALELGVSDKTIERWENNLSEPTLNEVKQLAKLLSVSINFLLEGIATSAEDNNTLTSIQKQKSIIHNRTEAYNFVNEIENIDEAFFLELFNISETQILCNLELIIKHGNLELFKAINEKYDFYIETEISPDVTCLSNANAKSRKQITTRKHPIILEFRDLQNTTNIEFYKYALELLDTKIAKEIEEDKQRRAYGIRYNITDKTPILCSALDNVYFDFENDSVNNIILFLLDNGAYIRQHYVDDGHTHHFKDTFMTNFVRSTIINYNKLKSKIVT